MIIDSFLFNDEKELLELRLKVLYDYVDKFVIVECDHTFSGESKNLTCKKILKELGFEKDPKIEVVEVSEKEGDIEKICRNLQTSKCSDDDILIGADIDEIPNPKHLQKCFDFINNNPGHLLLNQAVNLQYKVKYALSLDGINADIQYIPVMAKGSFWKFNSLYHVRFLIGQGGHINQFPFHLHIMPVEYGWHLSWMGGKEKTLHKLKSHSWFQEPHEVREKIKGKETQERIYQFDPSKDKRDLLGREGHTLIDFDYSEFFKLLKDLPHIKDFLLSRNI